MILRKGNMWKEKADLYVVTTNATIKNNGQIVMGRGAAKQARDMFQGFAQAAGKVIEDDDIFRIKPPYGFKHVGVFKHLGQPYCLGIFQVKRHYHDKAQLDLIAQAEEDLRSHAVHHPLLVISLNFPGIGNGQLDRAAVLPIISRLPDNVQVWEL